MTGLSDFLPAWASPPGETIMQLLVKKNLCQDQLISALRITHGDFLQLLSGNLKITPARAKRLGGVLDTSPEFWLAREAQYRNDLRSLKNDDRQWVSSLPYADMARFGWVQATTSPAGRLNSALKFFGSASVDEWRDSWLSEQRGLTAYRTSPAFAARSASVAAWLRQGEIAASGIQTKPWSREIFKRVVPALKSLTRVREPAEFIPELQRRCASCGVAVVIVRAPRGCPASGATRVQNHQAILQLSGRYLRDDGFWFTFFHEVGHLILHESRLFLERSDRHEFDNREEDEANEFAGRVLIPPAHEAALCALPHDFKSIMRFARSLSVSPGIVVGQLQHRGLVPENKLNFLKRRYSWSK